MPHREAGYVASGSARCRFSNLDFGRIGVLIFASTSRQPLEGSRLRPRRRGEIPCQPRRQLGGRLARSRFLGLSLVPRTGSSSGNAIFEDEMGLIAVSSSGRAVCEDEMGPNPVSSSGRAVYEDEIGLAERGVGLKAELSCLHHGGGASCGGGVSWALQSRCPGRSPSQQSGLRT